MFTRRELFKTGFAALAASLSMDAAAATTQRAAPREAGRFWPEGIRLPVSLSLMFEAGGQPRREPPTPFGYFTPPPEYPDMPTVTWYRYGDCEGIPRMLDAMDKRNIKLTSHMIGAAVERNPGLAKEIVERGHEAAAHGARWDTQYKLTRGEESKFLREGTETVQRITGKRPIGFNAPGLRGTVNTLEILVELGYVYHIDDVSRDEPFLVELRNGRTIVVVPYAVYLNDIRAYESRFLSTEEFKNDLKNSFDWIYEEAAQRRRMLAITTHDRLLRPERVKVLTEFLDYIRTKPGVAFLRKDEIARIAANDPGTIREKFDDVYPGVL
ncbi:MAG TPA: polysaccharide deacetylase family protein [Terriglobales bacterium]|nr:polysaccharide deacetylase family protein [Terriglobales bacterium]